MKKLVMACIGLVMVFPHVYAEDIKVEPGDIILTEKQWPGHGRARSRVQIHQFFKSKIFKSASPSEQQEMIKKVQKATGNKQEMQAKKHNWSTSGKPPRHKRKSSIYRER